MLVAIPRLAAAVQASDPRRPRRAWGPRGGAVAAEHPAPVRRRPARGHHRGVGQPAHPDAEPRPARPARDQLPRQLLLRLEQRRRLRPEPRHAHERAHLARRPARPPRGEAPAGAAARGRLRDVRDRQVAQRRGVVRPGLPPRPLRLLRRHGGPHQGPGRRRARRPGRRPPDRGEVLQRAVRRRRGGLPQVAVRRRAVLLLRGVHRAARPAQPAGAVPGDVLPGSPAAPGELPAPAPVRQRHPQGHPR